MSFLQPNTSVSYRNILTIALPIIIGQLSITILHVTDTFFLTQLSEIALDAAGMGGLIFFNIVYPISGIAIGMQVFVARRLGEERGSEIGSIFDTTFGLLAMLSVLLLGGCFVLNQYGMSFLFHSPKVVSAIQEFFSFRCWGLPFALLTMVYRSFYTAIEKTKVIMVSTAVSVILNIVLNYVLIFGHWGFPALGIAGSGLASSCADFACFLICVVYTHLFAYHKKYKLYVFARWSMDFVRKLMQLSAPIMLKYLLGIVCFLIAFGMIEKVSERELAVAQVIRSTYIVFMVPIWGLSAAVNTLTSNLLGQNKPAELNQTVYKVLHLSILFSVITVIGHIFFPVSLLQVFVSDNLSLVQASLPSLRFMIGVQLCFAVAFILISGLEGVGDVRFVMKVEIVSCIIYILVEYWMIYELRMGALAIWIGEFIYWSGIIISVFFRMQGEKWKKHHL